MLLRLTYLVMHAELECLICSGAMRGKQYTYALLDERVPPVRMLEREEALAEPTRRYFTSHGPATVKDCAWCAGGVGMGDVYCLGTGDSEKHRAGQAYRD